jgi:hypothetical protein
MKIRKASLIDSSVHTTFFPRGPNQPDMENVSLIDDGWQKMNSTLQVHYRQTTGGCKTGGRIQAREGCDMVKAYYSYLRRSTSLQELVLLVIVFVSKEKRRRP